LIDPLGGALIVAAGVAAGTMNAIVGAGALVTFPTLLLLGYSPLVANVSNTVGIVPGSISGTIGYRRELAGQRGRAVPLLIAGALGGLTGAGLLLILPASAFRQVVPLLILVACVLVVIQPRLSRWLVERRPGGSAAPRGVGPHLFGAVYLTGIYGGYFGAAQGVILIAFLSIMLLDDLQRLNALKNAIALIVNGAASIVFMLVAPVDAVVVVLIAGGSILGGQLGASVGRRMSPFVLRGVIVVVGTTVAARMLLG
jgi:uncharacterized membrane protein YfcA